MPPASASTKNLGLARDRSEEDRSLALLEQSGQITLHEGRYVPTRVTTVDTRRDAQTARRVHAPLLQHGRYAAPARGAGRHGGERLDGGIRTSHTLLSAPNIFDFVRDCVNGTSNNCATGSNLDPDDQCPPGHGTAAASIIAGNNNLTNTFRGVTPIIIDSWKISTGCTTNISAEVRAFQAAVASLDRVIMANVQETTSETGATSTAADSAFDGGSVVVAAAGNSGPNASTITSFN